MGVCQCVDTNSLCINEIRSDNAYTNLNNENCEDVLLGKYKLNSSVSIVDYNQAMKGKNNKQNTAIRVQGTNFDSFGHRQSMSRQKMYENYQCNKSEVLFEDSVISKSLDTSMFDYYQHSRTVFNILNTIRLSPELYSNFLNILLNQIEKKTPVLSTITWQNENNCKGNKALLPFENNNEVFSQGNLDAKTKILIDEVKKYLTENEVSINILKAIRDFIQQMAPSGTSGENKSEQIIWNEKVYSVCYQYLIEVEENMNIKPDVTKKSASQRISEKLKSNSVCVEFNLNGCYSPEACVWYLLLGNYARLKNILVDNYEGGAACSFPTNNIHKMRTLVYYFNKSNRNIKIYGVKPISGKIRFLTLDEPFFEKIAYKDQIAGGTYKEEGDKLKVSFILLNGDIREETVVTSSSA